MMIKFQAIILLVVLSACVHGRQLIDAKFSSDEDNSIDALSDLFVPPYKHYAAMARFLVHELDWTSMGTISTLDNIRGFPMVNVISVADSARGEKSTGRIFFYLAGLDFTLIDLKSSNRLTALFTMEQSRNCSGRNEDAMEPTCARVMFSGSARKLEKDDKSYAFAENAMFSRHPAAKKWITVHDFYLCELNITQICVLDYYGGPHFVSTEEYFKADPEEVYGKRMNKANNVNFENNEVDEIERHHRRKPKSLHIKVNRDIEEISIEV
uniref:Putative pyridoxamine 5'-phosphate oxidase n=1 Tax=Lutzomyia longipalpis TaxID=7200 RepID=A0A7G3AV78_LUTLO